jgi:hypothetical protein
MRQCARGANAAFGDKGFCRLRVFVAGSYAPTRPLDLRIVSK